MLLFQHVLVFQHLDSIKGRRSGAPAFGEIAMMRQTMLFIEMALVAPFAVAQSTKAPSAKFEVASIRPCKYDPSQRSGGGNSAPGRLNIHCTPVKSLIGQAYLLFEDGRFRVGLPPPIEGGPAWLDSEGYEINARAEGAVALEMMSGPMLQRLLEDRFKLKVHREAREVPVYTLTVAKGGPKLRPFIAGSCTPVDHEKFPPFYALPTAEQAAKNCQATARRDGTSLKVEAQGMSLDEFAKLFLDTTVLDRPVIDKTGISGRFDFHLEYTPDRFVTPDQPGGGPSIFTAMQEQLGLKLEPAKGPGEFLVIDSVERPSEN